jgi:hypothetical protein
MATDTVQITLTRTQATLLRTLLWDADTENQRKANIERENVDVRKLTYKLAYAQILDKRAQTCRFIASKIGRDRRRKYIDLTAETFPMSR